MIAMATKELPTTLNWLKVQKMKRDEVERYDSSRKRFVLSPSWTWQVCGAGFFVVVKILLAFNSVVDPE